ncbi:MAG: hypothetical protein WCI55_04715 [Armatimonadota bacterium]
MSGTTFKCQHCGAFLDDNVEWCQSCGESTTIASDYRKPKINPWWLALTSLLAPVAICGSCAPGMFQSPLTFYFGWLSGIIFLVLVMIDYQDRRRKH